MNKRAVALALFLPAIATAAPAIPRHDLPAGFELVVAAAPPIVRHPIMGCLDDRGRLFIGDSAGVNWTQEQLDSNPPHRVLLLEDTDGDRVFDRVTVFADRMTFPQGACWLDGSLYVASPPGIWKLTDRDGDGVADERVMIVGGFEHTGNAADVHGPFHHPTNGRLYWCHGRKGHKVVRRDGTVVHAGKASGIWSCRPDGEDVQWHSLGCMDNPVEVDFTSDGDIIGVVNLYYNQPRGDTLVHWLPGGAYERPDLLDVIADLPRTLDRMPVVHNYGHVAVSGFTRYRSGALDPAWRDDLFVTFFNTQKVVRTRLVPAGSTYTATQHDFLRIHDSNVHLTDVIEDRDGSLLVLDTGGWFRRGCPASLEERPDIRGAIYRVRAIAPKTPLAPRVERPAPVVPLAEARTPREQRRALEVVAAARAITPAERTALLSVLGKTIDPALEHAAMYAGLVTRAFGLDDLRRATAPDARRRLLRILEQTLSTGPALKELSAVALEDTRSSHEELADSARSVLARDRGSAERLAPEFLRTLASEKVATSQLQLIVAVLAPAPLTPAGTGIITRMLEHPASEVRQAAWRLIARTSLPRPPAEWVERLEANLSNASPAEMTVLLPAVAQLAAPRLAAALGRYAAGDGRPVALRVKALGATLRPGGAIPSDSFATLLGVANANGSPAARAESIRILGRANLNDAQVSAIAPLLATAGPVELGELFKAVRRKTDAKLGRLCAEQLARSPFLGSLEESLVRSIFSAFPAEVFDAILLSALRGASADGDARRRRLEELTSAAGKGRAEEGRRLWSGSSCAACHVAGDNGGKIGPDLSRIGAARNARDLIESILFPDATLVRDFETLVVETADGAQHAGRLLRETGGAITIVDAGGVETSLPAASVVSRSVSPRSLMPPGLEQAFTQQQLLDLVAWLQSLR